MHFALCDFLSKKGRTTQCQSMSISVQRAERFLRSFRRQPKEEGCRSVPNAERRRLKGCFQASAVPRVPSRLRPADPRAVPLDFPEDDSSAGGLPAEQVS